MTPIPGDPFGAAVWGINILVDLLAIPDALSRLQFGIAAKAQKEGRDVTEDEQALLDAMLEQSKRARDGAT